jgi:subtilisin family serine protease
MARRLMIAILAFASVLATATHAGVIGQRLTDKLSYTPDMEFVKVWISLHEVDDLKQLRTVAENRTMTPQEKVYQITDRLQTDHRMAQNGLVEYLRTLETQGVARSIRQYWIANVVTAEVLAGQVAVLAARDDVKTVYSPPEIVVPVPDRIQQTDKLTAGVESNLTFVNAPAAWTAGYTGAGRLICSFDTGVDGAHPALVNKWKGQNGDSAAAWFDPRNQETFPHDYAGNGHGTHVMGIMVGANPATGDTVGVAPDARWISAAVIDIDGTNILDAFEWAANPDGDPNTIDDIPDVINHSWGVPDIGCTPIFWEMIDNTEALGIVNIFAAGNDGPTAQTIRNPAVRALDSLDCFAVGNVNHTVNPPLVYNTSSRGPSECNGAVKPNVMAPGYVIRSTIKNGFYGTLSGTSMSAPHVSGLVALLRQRNPAATVAEIKQAILTTTKKYSYSLPDNDYGWGMIDCMAALNALPAVGSPDVRVWAFDHDPIEPGDLVEGTIVLKNFGTTVTNVSAVITGTDPSLTVLDGAASFGTIASGDTARSAAVIRVQTSDTITTGRVLSLDLQINGTSYSHTAKLYFLVEPALSRAFADHNTGRIEFTVSNFGTYGAGIGSWYPAGGRGFTFDGGINDLYECGLVVGTDAYHLVDGIRNVAGEPDGDFSVEPGGNMVLIETPGLLPQRSFSVFSDKRSDQSLGLRIEQSTFAKTSAPDNDIIFLQYGVTNTNPWGVGGIYFGIYLDWDIQSYASNAGGYEMVDEFAWMAYNSGSAKSKYRAIKVVDHNTVTAFTGEGEIVYFPQGFTEQEKYDALSAGFSTANTYKNSRTDLWQIVAAGPVNLAAGATDTVAFALFAANDFSAITDAAARAQMLYDSLLSSCCIGIRGNVDGDFEEKINVADMTTLISHLFKGYTGVTCLEEADVNGDGLINITDMTYLIGYLFTGGPHPVPCGP